VIDETNVWDSAEDFLFLLLSIPDFRLRLQLWHFENSFQEHVDKISSAYAGALNGCDCMMKSRSIRHLLGAVLVAGNYLNGGTPRGRADGFAVDTLVQVQNLKSSQADSPATLLDYLVQGMDSKYPSELESIFSAGNEAEQIKIAARTKPEELAEELQALRRKSYAILDMAQASSSSEEQAVREHLERIALCTAELEELQVCHSRLNEKYAELCSWFHAEEGSKKKPFDDFFGVWDKFMMEIDSARQALVAHKKQASARRQRSTSRTGRKGGRHQDHSPSAVLDPVHQTDRVEAAHTACVYVKNLVLKVSDECCPAGLVEKGVEIRQPKLVSLQSCGG